MTAAPMEHTSPMPTPAAVNQPASFKMSPYTEWGCAPSAILIPISRVFWLTEYATTPYSPTTPSSNASAAKPPTSHAAERCR